MGCSYFVFFGGDCYDVVKFVLLYVCLGYFMVVGVMMGVIVVVLEVGMLCVLLILIVLMLFVLLGELV